MAVATAATSPRWQSEITSWTPVRPRSRSPPRNSAQNASVSLSPTWQPSTSRRPSADTPVAMTTAWDTTRPPFARPSGPLTRTLQYVASRKT